VPEPGAFGPRYHEVRGDAYYAKGDRAAALKEYRSAQAGAAGDSFLALKIADLTADTPAPAPATAAAAKPTPPGAGR